MHILFISRAYGQHAGGMERLSYELSKSFPEAQCIVNETKQSRSLASTRLRSIIFAISVLPKAIIAAKNADVVHIGDPLLSFIGYCITRIRHIPIIVTVHGLDISYTNPLYQLYLRLFFRSFDHYIAISEYAKNLLSQHHVRGIVSVIPPGITDDSIANTYTRNDLGRLLYRNVGNRIVFATIGRLVTRKGHEWFIKQVIPKLPRTALYVLAGDGPQYNQIAKLIKELKLEDRVIVLGRISHADKTILLNTIDAFIQPNIYIAGDAEGFGIAPLEAALCGRAVFASNVDGIPSAIHHGKNGVLISPKETTAWVNALTTFIQEPKKYHPSSADARAYTLATFNWQHIAQQYSKVFQDAENSGQK